jgi:hypothetical protein
MIFGTNSLLFGHRAFFRSPFLAGEWLAEQQPIEVKKHGRKAKSIFRYRFDYLRRVLLNIEQHQPQFQQAL